MTSVPLYEQERIDDLLTHELHIIQSDEVFSFSMDAVLLARFASIPRQGGRILDLCTGNGVVPLLLSTRTTSHIEGIEIQERLADMAKRSVQMNGLEDQIQIRLGDLRELVKETGHGVYDAITVNPPYMPLTGGDLKLNSHQAIARHEVHCTLEEVIQSSMKLIRNGGKVSMVHKPQRLGEILSLLRKYRLEPKVVRFVHPRKHMEANIVLIEALRDGKPDLRILPPLIVYGDDGQYCPEIMDIYYGAKEGNL
ncbi:tRNA1(Val) A37 N6-methylase TrmN6 [Paenibacillus shirakamiensis]|uniref:tRNA1(Val) A37 N6-methylase TrmN6 n=2 Tax=Paenibacillus shirakamiensis TaxID=1265935 RepID=A0ABS4JLU7_9BACL|nr:tRNA1(Val) (adenine(37)-N6)-methyltransferase [Paenibacillus shirakamiensis]MBP2002687.1 tRNA1(Val) A37 N6-methylase TrmN6 [Paenibacillus shirakamiensis]